MAFTGTGVGNNSEGNYVVFTGITGTSFTLNAGGTAGTALRAPINGFQIIQVPEPTSALLVALGSLALLRRRRA